MRIAYVVPRCVTSNSHGRYVLELVEALGPGHDVRVFSSAFPEDRKLAAHLTRIPLPDRPAMARLLSWWIASPFLVRGRGFDVVHSQGGDTAVSTVTTAPCCNKAIRLALEEAGEGWRGYGRQRVARLNRLNVRLMEIADRLCMARSGIRRVIVPSRKVGDELRAFYGVKAEKLALVPHGVDLKAFSPDVARARRAASRAAFALGADDLVAVYVGGAYRLKGLAPLLEALRRIPDARLRLLVVGVAENAELRAERVRGLAERVTFAGFLEDMPGVYAAGDLFVLPTLYDSFSLATMEAMACGLPPIVSRRAGVSELLTDGGDAILLERPTDVREIADALERLHADASLRESIGVRARSTAIRYSSEEMARRTLAVYAEAAR